MRRDLEAVSARHPVGQVATDPNPGRRGNGQVATVSGYLHRTGEPDRVSYIELSFGTRRHVVTINQFRNYYIPRTE